MTVTNTYLVTGALGCIGAWTVRRLLDGGHDVVAFDRDSDPSRLRLLLTEAELAALKYVEGDITDRATVERTLDGHGVTNVIHLAALQVPFCKADPIMGAAVNVVGTVTMFEAVRARLDRIDKLVYASSIAKFDIQDAGAAGGRLAENAEAHPGTHYGVYKQANEGTAHVYWQDNGIPSIGLRPYTVYGPGRDQGVTSSPTRAMAAAAIGRPYHIPYGGRGHMQFVGDVATTLVRASAATIQGAHVFNLGGSVVHMREVVQAIETVVPDAAGRVTFDDVTLPFPEEVEHNGLEQALGPIPETNLVDGVRQSIDRFRELHQAGRLPERAYA